MTDDLGKTLKNLETRYRTSDTMAIAGAWVALAKRERFVERVTHKALAVVIERVAQGNRVEYLVKTAGKRARQIGRFWCQAPMGGRVQVTNAKVDDGEAGGKDWRRQGIGSTVYALIEADVRGAGGDGIEPHWGSMSEDAIGFWEARRPDMKGRIRTFNGLGVLASGLFD